MIQPEPLEHCTAFVLDSHETQVYLRAKMNPSLSGTLSAIRKFLRQKRFTDPAKCERHLEDLRRATPCRGAYSGGGFLGRDAGNRLERLLLGECMSVAMR
jgi:hypothetical protein